MHGLVDELRDVSSTAERAEQNLSNKLSSLSRFGPPCDAEGHENGFLVHKIFIRNSAQKAKFEGRIGVWNAEPCNFRDEDASARL